MATENPLFVGLDVGTTKICTLISDIDETGRQRIAVQHDAASREIRMISRIGS